jgi:threonine/homoserine/homoserine lactone efflux protein
VVTRLDVFVLLAALLAVTPGPDTALVTRNALVGGRRAGAFTILGIALGLTAWTLAAAFGIAALLRASEPAFLALKLVGAAYLAFLGLQAIVGALRPQGPRELGPVGRHRLPPRVAFRQGLLTNLGNPKIAIFFTSFLPQFAPSDGATFASFVVLGLLFCAIGLGWLSLYNLVVATVGDFLRRPGPRRVLEGVTGTVLLAFGIRLATERG